jgi:hypothetical protein
VTKIVYLGGSKGGSAKTTTVHLAALGAIGVLDGHSAANLGNILSASRTANSEDLGRAVHQPASDLQDKRL